MHKPIDPELTPESKATRKSTWAAPRLHKIGTLAEVVRSGGGKGSSMLDGQAGGDVNEFMPNT